MNVSHSSHSNFAILELSDNVMFDYRLKDYSKTIHKSVMSMTTNMALMGAAWFRGKSEKHATWVSLSKIAEV